MSADAAESGHGRTSGHDGQRVLVVDDDTLYNILLLAPKRFQTEFLAQNLESLVHGGGTKMWRKDKN